jgi:cobalamin biosynthetic protein CobC
MTNNIDSVFTQHGGNLSFIAENFPNAPRPFVDLSTGINPYPYPLQMDNTTAHRLADVVEMEQARSAAAKYYGANPENINLASGMQPLMFALAALRLQKFGVAKVAILSPTYSEYEKLWRAAGHNILLVNNLEELAQGDVAIICSPNNPDGKIYSPEQLEKLQNDWLIIDESFADLLPPSSLIPHPPSLIRMRSCGKFFGIAGLRVSAVIAPQKISEYLRVVVGDWSISTPVCSALSAMFSDSEWAEKTRIKLARESEKWRAILAQYFTIIGYTSLFTLVETDDANSWHERLAKQGILVRKFDYNNRWLRFGLPDKKDLERLERTFK